jgi:PAS domain S-box-containing protein
MTGYEETDFLNGHLRWEELIHPGDLQLYKKFCVNLRKSLDAQKLEYRIISAQGNIMWVIDMAVPVIDDSKNMLRIEGLVLDITSRKKLKRSCWKGRRSSTVY